MFDPKTQTWEEKEIEVSNRRAGYDICLSAPKSVSLYLAMTGDKDVERMLREAAAETMSAMEANMETRLRGEDEEGRNRDDDDRTTGNMAYATFLHRETRPIEGKCDPHAHITATRSTRPSTTKRTDGKRLNSATSNQMVRGTRPCSMRAWRTN